jgi:hypothetical protein
MSIAYEPAIRRGQKIIIEDGFYTIEGTVIRDVDDTSDMIYVMEEQYDNAVMKVRGDLAVSIIVDGVELL